MGVNKLQEKGLDFLKDSEKIVETNSVIVEDN